MKRAFIRHGFTGQILHFVPAALSAEVGGHPLGRGLQLLHAGWFPSARHHLIQRPGGLNEQILIYCVRGCGWCEMAGRRQPLGPREVVWIPAGTAHAYGASEQEPWSIYWAHFTGAESDAYGAAFSGAGGHRAVSAPEAAAVEAQFGGICELLSEGHTVRNLLLASHGLRHALALLGLQGVVSAKRLPGAPVHDMDASIEHMRANLNRPLRLVELARVAGLSPARYSAVFRRRTGLPPVAYHVRLRMQAACHVLDTSASSVKEVAAELGYDDPYHFSRVFRRTIGCPPTAYRRSVKG